MDALFVRNEDKRTGFATVEAYVSIEAEDMTAGVGVFEGSSILLYSIMGIPLAEAAAAVLIGRAFTFGLVSLMGMLATMGLTKYASPRSTI